ncbi:hypothetical protein, partial [Escherichia coli]|uniref:hypothetical protein n=1 Tax=Escherichia coli TaxID=562 RepID=UPI00390B43EC
MAGKAAKKGVCFHFKNSFIHISAPPRRSIKIVGVFFFEKKKNKERYIALPRMLDKRVSQDTH